MKRGLISLAVGFGSVTLIAWLSGSDIFHPARGIGCGLWFICSAYVSVLAYTCPFWESE